MSDCTELRRAFNDGDEAAIRACLRDDPTLLDETADDGLPFVRSALHRESHGQREGLSALFLEAGAGVDVHTAAALGDTGLVERFLEEDETLVAARDVWDMQPIHWAAHCGHTELVTLLVERGGGVNEPAASWTPLHLSIEIGHGETANRLIDLGADLTARLDHDHDRMTPLEMAKAWNLPEMAALLEDRLESPS